eukprot:1152485-Pleurochrysis_carterae.AAC.1
MWDNSSKRTRASVKCSNNDVTQLVLAAMGWRVGSGKRANAPVLFSQTASYSLRVCAWRMRAVG